MVTLKRESNLKPKISVGRCDNMSIAEFACAHKYEEAEITLGRWNLKSNFMFKERDDVELVISSLNHEYLHAILEEYHGCDVSTRYDYLYLNVDSMKMYMLLNIGHIEVG